MAVGEIIEHGQRYHCPCLLWHLIASCGRKDDDRCVLQLLKVQEEESGVAHVCAGVLCAIQENLTALCLASQVLSLCRTASSKHSNNLVDAHYCSV